MHCVVFSVCHDTRPPPHTSARQRPAAGYWTTSQLSKHFESHRANARRPTSISSNTVTTSGTCFRSKVVSTLWSVWAPTKATLQQKHEMQRKHRRYEDSNNTHNIVCGK
jgi:hypothetical protein